MNVQIFGTRKCADTRKAERWFKERGIKFQGIDLNEKGMSRGELQKVAAAVGGMAALINTEGTRYRDLGLLHAAPTGPRIEDKLFEDPLLLRTPIVRNGNLATIGYQPDVWATWK
jgi:Spx/MgsR family transcriptional regulator